MSTILVVDDDLNMRKILSKIARMGGHDCVEAEGAEKALMMYEDCDMVILDYKMPRMNGDELARKIRSQGGKGRYIPIIVASGHDVEDVFDGIDIVDFIKKPFPNDKMLEVINECANASSGFERLHDVAHRLNHRISSCMDTLHKNGIIDTILLSKSDDVRVLVVDDEDVMRVFVGAAMAKMGYDVETASSAEEAIEINKEFNAEILITDINLGRSRLNGNDLVGKLNIPTIVMTGFPEAVDCRVENKIRVMVKPFDVDLLEESVIEMVG